MAFAYGKNLNNTASRQATIEAAISGTDTTLTISAGDAATLPLTPFSARLTNQFNPDDYDLVLVSNVTGGGVITCERDYGGTTGKARIIGDRFTLEVTAEDFGSSTHRLFLASFDSPDNVKEAAWAYSLDGLGDLDMVQAAIDEIERHSNEISATGSRNGIIEFSHGFFSHYLADPTPAPFVTIPATPPPPDDVSKWRLMFRGQGRGQTVFEIIADATGTRPLIDFLGNGGPRCYFEDMQINHESITVTWQGATTPIVGASEAGTAFYDGLNLFLKSYAGRQY